MSCSSNTNFNQLIECLRPFKWSLLISTGAYQDFTCLYSDGKYQSNQNYRLYEILPLVNYMAAKQNILKFSKSDLVLNPESKDVCYIHRWNDFSQQVVIFHTENANHFDNYKLNDFLTLNDQFISKKFIDYYQNYQLNKEATHESKALPSV